MCLCVCVCVDPHKPNVLLVAVYIQAVDESGRNFTRSPGSDAFVASVKMSVGQGRYSRVNSQLHDRGDGTFQLFYVFNTQPEVLQIDIRTKNNELVGGKPLLHLLPEYESCYCPTKNHDDFAQQYGCPAMEKQLEKDLEKFPVITRELLSKAREALIGKESCFVHYVIKDNRVFGKAYGQYQGFKQYIDEMIVSLARRVVLRRFLCSS